MFQSRLFYYLCSTQLEYMEATFIKVGKVTVRNSNTDRITLEIPQGMTGRQLVRWKNRNKAVLVPLGVSIPPLPADDSAADDVEGDRLRRASGL